MDASDCALPSDLQIPGTPTASYQLDRDDYGGGSDAFLCIIASVEQKVSLKAALRRHSPISMGAASFASFRNLH